VTSAYEVGLQWTAGAYDGGTPIIDYQLSFKESTAETFSVISGIGSLSYTVASLQPSILYDFVVQARNLVGLSPESVAIQVLAAQIPDEPTNLIEKPGETTSTQIGLSWDAPTFDGGSPILDYRIWYDDGIGGSENFVELATVTELTYLATGLN
jgi:hypothetical protein